MISIIVEENLVDFREISIVNIFVKLFENLLFQLIDNYKFFFNFIEKLFIILSINDDYVDNENIKQ